MTAWPETNGREAGNGLDKEGEGSAAEAMARSFGERGEGPTVWLDELTEARRGMSSVRTREKR